MSKIKILPCSNFHYQKVNLEKEKKEKIGFWLCNEYIDSKRCKLGFGFTELAMLICRKSFCLISRLICYRLLCKENEYTHTRIQFFHVGI